MIVGQRFALAFGINELFPMQRAAMNEIVERAGRVERDARNAKKIPLNMQRFTVRTQIKPPAD